jgi:hypothetical protein
VFEGKLTQKQRAFAEEVFKGTSATQSYTLAGYSVKTRTVASVEASKLLKNPSVSAYLNYLKSEKEKSVVIDEVKLILELQAIGLSRVDQLIDLSTGQMLPKEELLKNPSALAAISDLSIDEVETDQGIRRKRKLKMHPKIQAIETLLRVSGYLSDINLGLRIMESYGCKLRQNKDGKWMIEE